MTDKLSECKCGIAAKKDNEPHCPNGRHVFVLCQKQHKKIEVCNRYADSYDHTKFKFATEVFICEFLVCHWSYP